MYSNSAGWTLIVAEHHQTDDIDEIRDALDGKIPHQRIDAVIALARIDGYETLTLAQVCALHNTEYVAPLADFPFVGLSADWLNPAWVIDGDKRMHGPHTVIVEYDDDGNWYVLHTDMSLDADGNREIEKIGGPHITPLGALTAYRTQA